MSLLWLLLIIALVLLMFGIINWRLQHHSNPYRSSHRRPMLEPGLVKAKEDKPPIIPPMQTNKKGMIEPIWADHDPDLASLELNPYESLFSEKKTVLMPPISANDKPKSPTPLPPEQAPRKPSPVIVVSIFANPGHPFVGYELLQALLAAGFRYGEMSIFHRYENPNGTGKVLFSLVQATEPGIFNMDAIGALKCNGLSLFMRLSGPEHTLKVLDLMLTSAQQLAEELGGSVTDTKRQPLSEEAIKTFRSQIQSHQQAFKPTT